MKKLILVIYSTSITGVLIAPAQNTGRRLNPELIMYSPDKATLLEYHNNGNNIIIYANNQPILTITIQDPEKKNKILQDLGLVQGSMRCSKTLFITQILQVILDHGRFGRPNNAGLNIVWGKLKTSILHLFIRQTQYCDLYPVKDCAKRFLGSCRKIAESEEESELSLSLAFGGIKYNPKCAKDDLIKLELPLIAHKGFFKEFNGHWQDAKMPGDMLKLHNDDILHILLLLCPFDQIYDLIENEKNLSNLSLFKNELVRRIKVIEGLDKNKYDEFIQDPIINNAINNSNIQISREEQVYNKLIKRYFIPIMTLLLIYYMLHIIFGIFYSIDFVAIYFICIIIILVCAQRASYLNEIIAKIKANLIRDFNYAMYDDIIRNNEDFKYIQKISKEIKAKKECCKVHEREIEWLKWTIYCKQIELHNSQLEANRLIELQKIIDKLLQKIIDNEKLEAFKEEFAQQPPAEDHQTYCIIFDQLPCLVADINFESFTQFLNKEIKRINDKLIDIEKLKQKIEASIESRNEEIREFHTEPLQKLTSELTELIGDKDRSNFNIYAAYFFLLFNWFSDLIFQFEFAKKYPNITLLISINLLILMPYLISVVLYSLPCKTLAAFCKECIIKIFTSICLVLKMWYIFSLLFIQIECFISYEISKAISGIVYTLIDRNKLADLFYMPSVLLELIISILIVANFNNGINQKDIYNTVNGYKKRIKYCFYLFYIFIFTVGLRFICLLNLRFELIPTIIIGKLLFTITHLLLRTYYDSEQPLQLNSLDSIFNLLCIVFNIIYYLYYINLIFILNYMSIFLVVLLIDSYFRFSDKLLLQFKIYMEKEFNSGI